MTDNHDEKSDLEKQRENTNDIDRENPLYNAYTENTDLKKASINDFSIDLGDEDELLDKINIKKDEKRIAKNNPSKKKKHKPKASKGITALIYILIVFSVSFGIAIYGLVALNDVLGILRKDEIITVVVPENATVDTVAAILKDNGVISQKITFRLYIKFLHPKISFFEGVYNLNPHEGYDVNVEKIRKKAAVRKEVTVTIIEGTTLADIIDILEEKKVCDASRLVTALESIDLDSYAFIKDMPKNADRKRRLEGYLFPDTYNFFKDSAETEVVKKFMDAFNAKVTPEHYEKAKALNMNMDEVVTLASIIQKEAGIMTEMKKVSSVFHNRLKKDSPFPMLQSDPTCWYPHPNRNSVPEAARTDYFNSNKYNTYKIKGLPPGAICNPGIDAINAVLEPDSTPYYFFVTDKNNKYYYAETFPQHEKNCATAEKAGIKAGTDTSSK